MGEYMGIYFIVCLYAPANSEVLYRNVFQVLIKNWFVLRHCKISETIDNYFLFQLLRK